MYTCMNMRKKIKRMYECVDAITKCYLLKLCFLLPLINLTSKNQWCKKKYLKKKLGYCP